MPFNAEVQVGSRINDSVFQDADPFKLYLYYIPGL